MINTQKYIRDNKEKFLSELFQLLRLLSISADPKYSKDVVAAEMVRNNLEKIGLTNCKLFETDGFPIVYGEKIIDSNFTNCIDLWTLRRTAPPDPIDLWKSKPFEPEIRNEKIYARGACDDKGQFFMHVKAVESMIAAGELCCNVKFMIEGEEEEIGSENLEIFVKNNKQLLSSDVILISDTGIISNDTPSITTGLRGLATLKLK